MRILLTANASYAPPRGGATRSNLVWLDELAKNDHECRIVCGPSGPGAELHRHESIGLFAEADPARRVAELCRQIGEFQPDWVLVSSEDVGHGLLREAHRLAVGRVVYLAHTPQFFPFGPASWNPDPHAADLVAEAAGIVVIGRHMAEYVKRALHRSAAVIHPPIYSTPEFPPYSNFERGLITMINPCAVKGISLFLQIAARMPHRDFAVVPGWGTTTQDRAALSGLPNVQFLPNAPRIDDILGQTRILLMPSLWYEGFGLIVMESMQRGIPVIASDSGGLMEAKHGTGYVIPVRAIEQYQPVFDEQGMPKPVIPENEPDPWMAAITQLLGDRTVYNRESALAREAAERFMDRLVRGGLEMFLEALRPVAAPRPKADARSIESLTPAQRALLLQRLHRRTEN